MNNALGLAEANDPLFCRQLAKVVSSTGSPVFAEEVLELVDSLVPVHGLGMSEWTLDISQASIRDITPLGNTGITPESAGSATLDQNLLPSILHMNDPLLIQRRLPMHGHSKRSVHQCSLVAGSGNLRHILCFYRQVTSRTFSLSEMSVLKNLSDTLLILLKHHSRSVARAGQSAKEQDKHSDSVDKAFCKKLVLEGVPLSAREQQVCVGLLSGITVAELAERLHVKNSSIESYLKRAAGKLGVKGRHGLARWMASG